MAANPSLERLKFPVTDVPVLADYDVLVAGSGSAGVCAAISAARMGARVAIVEAFPNIGGTAQPPTLLFFAAGFDHPLFDGAGWKTVQKMWDALRSEHHWINPRGGHAISPPFFYPGKPGFNGFNVTRSPGIDATKTADLVRMEIEQREQVDEFFYKFLKPFVRGCQGAFLTGTHFISGIRESRRIRGEFVLTTEPLLAHYEFPDAVAWSNYPIDRHSPIKGTTVLHNPAISSYYSVPFRVMVPAKTTNLLVSGRCVSADEMSFSAIRVMGTTMLLGEAAGIGAAIMARYGHSARDHPVQTVRDELHRRGALIEREPACANDVARA